MTPKQADADNRSSSDLFRERLDNLLNQRHTLYRLADLITWSVFDRELGSLYCPDIGSPGKPMRLMVGLQYLKHCYGLSDEAVVAGWVENPYWQYFCGETYFQHVLPIYFAVSPVMGVGSLHEGLKQNFSEPASLLFSHGLPAPVNRQINLL